MSESPFTSESSPQYEVSDTVVFKDSFAEYTGSEDERQGEIIDRRTNPFGEWTYFVESYGHFVSENRIKRAV